MEFTIKPSYKIVVKNIKTIDDVKLILGAMDLTFTPIDGKDFNELMHLLEPIEYVNP